MIMYAVYVCVYVCVGMTEWVCEADQQCVNTHMAAYRKSLEIMHSEWMYFYIYEDQETKDRQAKKIVMWDHLRWFSTRNLF